MILNANGHSLMDVVLRFFQEEHWNYMRIENEPVVRAGFHGERGTWICYARIDVEHQRFLFLSYMGMNIQPQYRPAVAEYLMRVNYHLGIGNFEMDYDKGEVRFRGGIALVGGTLTVEQVRSLAYTCVRAMDQYFTGVMTVVHGGLSPEAALARVDAQVESPLAFP